MLALQKLSPFFTIASNVALTGTIVQVGAVFCVANFTRAAVDVLYVANGGGGTGSPIIAVDISRSPTTSPPTTDADWRPQLILDGASFAVGAITAYTERVKPVSPSGAGTTFSTSWPDIIDVSCHFWLRVRMADVDGALPGTVSVYGGGSVT
jgi:hypothetical protein